MSAAMLKKPSLLVILAPMDGIPDTLVKEVYNSVRHMNRTYKEHSQVHTSSDKVYNHDVQAYHNKPKSDSLSQRTPDGFMELLHNTPLQRLYKITTY
jgi:hypothetical protein